MRADTRQWLEDDWSYGWHPFTDQEQWEGAEVPVIVAGEGVFLIDSEGRRYYDGNSSIWTNIHGHRHPKLVAAISEQASALCHSSYLGLANARASELAAQLCRAAGMARSFFSDNGSTAIEAALRMELQWRHQNGEPQRRGFVAFENGYHGDTLGAASLGGVGRFFTSIEGLGPEVNWAHTIEDLEELDAAHIAAVIIEPLIQGVNEMRPWPSGMLKQIRDWSQKNGVHLILDEVMTGFGRTGALFACQAENVIPDYLCLAKGLTGGTMPLAATLTTDEIYQAFKGTGRTFYYGHSYTANPLGCAVALANLELCLAEDFLPRIQVQGEVMAEVLLTLRSSTQVKETRRCGMVAGIELVGDGSGRVGKEVCQKLRELGMLTRPILDTVVWMPPLVSTPEELQAMGQLFIEALS